MDCSNILSLFVVEGEPTPAPTAPVSSNEGKYITIGKKLPIHHYKIL